MGYYASEYRKGDGSTRWSVTRVEALGEAIVGRKSTQTWDESDVATGLTEKTARKFCDALNDAVSRERKRERTRRVVFLFFLVAFQSIGVTIASEANNMLVLGGSVVVAIFITVKDDRS